MRTQMNKPRNSQRGSLMVESALVLLIVVVVLIGTMDVARLLFVQQSLTERVRVAARYGAVNTYNQTAVENMVLYNQATIPAAGSPLFQLSRSMVTVTRQDAGTPEDRVVVSVSNFPVEFITPFVAGITYGVSITGSASYELF